MLHHGHDLDRGPPLPQHPPAPGPPLRLTYPSPTTPPSPTTGPPRPHRRSRWRPIFWHAPTQEHLSGCNLVALEITINPSPISWRSTMPPDSHPRPLTHTVFAGALDPFAGALDPFAGALDPFAAPLRGAAPVFARAFGRFPLPSTRPVVLCIEGNICSGKSTLLQLRPPRLQHHPRAPLRVALLAGRQRGQSLLPVRGHGVVRHRAAAPPQNPAPPSSSARPSPPTTCFPAPP